jgi:hypothetical protein
MMRSVPLDLTCQATYGYVTVFLSLLILVGCRCDHWHLHQKNMADISAPCALLVLAAS